MGKPLKMPLLKNPSIGKKKSTYAYDLGARNVTGSMTRLPTHISAKAARRPQRSASGPKLRYPASAPALSRIVAQLTQMVVVAASAPLNSGRERTRVGVQLVAPHKPNTATKARPEPTRVERRSPGRKSSASLGDWMTPDARSCSWAL